MLFMYDVSQQLAVHPWIFCDVLNSPVAWPCDALWQLHHICCKIWVKKKPKPYGILH